MATVAPGRHEGLTGAADDSIDPSARKRRGPLDDIAGDDKAIQSQVSVKCRGGTCQEVPRGGCTRTDAVDVNC